MDVPRPRDRTHQASLRLDLRASENTAVLVQRKDRILASAQLLFLTSPGHTELTGSCHRSQGRRAHKVRVQVTKRKGKG